MITYGTAIQWLKEAAVVKKEQDLTAWQERIDAREQVLKDMESIAEAMDKDISE